MPFWTTLAASSTLRRAPINFKEVRFVLIIVHKMARNESKRMLSV